MGAVQGNLGLEQGQSEVIQQAPDDRAALTSTTVKRLDALIVDEVPKAQS
jgi:hypothetical protein